MNRVGNTVAALTVVTTLLILSLWAGLTSSAPLRPLHGDRPLVVCSTTVFGSIVQELAGDSVDVQVIASPSICPGHYDVKPSDVYAVGEADLIFYHGFEPWVEELVEASRTNATLVKIGGPWNNPSGAKNYYCKVADALEKYLGLDVSDRLDEALSEVNQTFSQIREELQELGANQTNVICMQWQVGFVSQLGFNVVKDYPPPETLSPEDVSELISVGKSKDVALVIDNLQSGTEFGEYLAEQIGAVHVVLTNFPGTEPDVNNITAMYLWNAEQLSTALEHHEVMVELSSVKSLLRVYSTATYCLIAVVVAEAVVIAYALRVRRPGGSGA